MTNLETGYFSGALWVTRVAAMVSLLLVLVAGPAYAADITVNTSADDSAANGNCTLREAIMASNTGAPVDGCAAGQALVKDNIRFAIPGDGPHTIAPALQLPTITQPATIDGYTEQLGESIPASPNTATDSTTNAVLRIVLSGASANPPSSTTGVIGLAMEGGGTTIRGLVINGFRSATNGAGGEGIFLRNIANNTGNVIEGNFIGTDANGTADVGNQSAGVVAFGQSTGNTIGGTTPATRNLVSGNNRNGIEVQSSGNEIRHNLVGTGRTGVTGLGNSISGILVGGGSSGNIVAENLVAFNGSHGVRVQDDTTSGASILSNSIFSNGGLGINLVDINDPTTGVTPNDPGDADMGPNNLQNFPKLRSAETSRRGTVIKGVLGSTASATFTIQFFSNTEKDSSGFGEGQTFLGEKEVTTGSEGRASFSFKPPNKVRKGSFVTATATDPDGNTSEFSAARKVRRV